MVLNAIRSGVIAHVAKISDCSSLKILTPKKNASKVANSTCTKKSR